MSYFWITILVIIALLVVWAAVYWSDIPKHHTWSRWSKPYKISRLGYFYITREAYRYFTYHQSRHCIHCGVIKVQEIDRTAYEGEKEQ